MPFADPCGVLRSIMFGVVWALRYPSLCPLDRRPEDRGGIDQQKQDGYKPFDHADEHTSLLPNSSTMKNALRLRLALDIRHGPD